MAMFFKRYLSDIAVLLACLGFGAFVLSEAYRAHRQPQPWGSEQTTLALAGR